MAGFSWLFVRNIRGNTITIHRYILYILRKWASVLFIHISVLRNCRYSVLMKIISYYFNQIIHIHNECKIIFLSSLNQFMGTVDLAGLAAPIELAPTNLISTKTTNNNMEYTMTQSQWYTTLSGSRRYHDLILN